MVGTGKEKAVGGHDGIRSALARLDLIANNGYVPLHAGPEVADHLQPFS
jgi:hypothetical protein